jgi:hypothetical protein
LNLFEDLSTSTTIQIIHHDNCFFDDEPEPFLSLPSIKRYTISKEVKWEIVEILKKAMIENFHPKIIVLNYHAFQPVAPTEDLYKDLKGYIGKKIFSAFSCDIYLGDSGTIVLGE